jgi:hypothetical protein
VFLFCFLLFSSFITLDLYSYASRCLFPSIKTNRERNKNDPKMGIKKKKNEKKKKKNIIKIKNKNK